MLRFGIPQDTNHERPARANFVWTLIGRIVYSASQWGIIIVLTKLGSVSTVGQFSFALAATAPVMVFANLQLRVIYATDAHSGANHTAYRNLRILTTAIALGCLLGFVVLNDFSPEASWAIALMAVAKAIESAQDLYYGVYQRYRRMDRFGQSLFARGCLGVAGVALVMLTTGRLAWAVLALGVAWFVVFIGFDRRCADDILTKSNRVPRKLASVGVRNLAALGLPMGLVSLLSSLTQNVPRYFVEMTYGEEGLGFYAPLTYIVTIGSAFIFSISAPVIPTLARHYTHGAAHDYGRISAKLIATGAAFGGIGVILTWIVGEPALRMVYNADFAHYHTVFIWIAVMGAFQFVMVLSLHALTAARWMRIQPLIYAATLVATTSLAWVLIPRYGLLGAAWASTIGFAFGALAAALMVFRAWTTVSRHNLPA